MASHIPMSLQFDYFLAMITLAVQALLYICPFAEEI
jgi:hypothetical protein